MKKFSDFINEKQDTNTPEELKKILDDIQKTTGAQEVKYNPNNDSVDVYIKNQDLEMNPKNLIKTFLDNYKEQIREGNNDFDSEFSELRDFRNRYYQDKISWEKAAEMYFYGWDYDDFLDTFGYYWVAKESFRKNFDKITKKYDNNFKGYIYLLVK